MLKMIKGCSVPHTEMLQEQYQAYENSLTANVGADKIEDVIKHFLSMHSDEPVFFILELPTNINDEPKDENGIVKEFHKDVYYIDGISVTQALYILEKHGELLINDGISSFGFGCHQSGDEIMLAAYNIAMIYSGEIKKYDSFFETHGITQTDNLITAWDTFSDDTSGSCNLYVINGKNVYSILDDYKDWEIYFSERRFKFKRIERQ